MDVTLSVMAAYRKHAIAGIASIDDLFFEKRQARNDNPPPASDYPRAVYYLTSGGSREIAKTCSQTTYELGITFRAWNSDIETASVTVGEHEDLVTNEATAYPSFTGGEIIEWRMDGTNYKTVDSEAAYGEQRIVIVFSQPRVK